MNEQFFCLVCSENLEIRYNPFLDMDHDGHDNESNDPELTKISSILKSCRSLTVTDINNTHKDITSAKNSLFFLNIDGNKSNFDSLVAELTQYKYTHSIIGLAETNTDPELSDLYQLDGYNNFYQGTLPGKSTGSGVALYVHSTLNVTVLNRVSHVTANLETLFIKVSKKSIRNNEHLTIGVVYRPPSGDFDTAMNELSNILDKLPKTSVHIMGDFNVNLHDKISTKVGKIQFMERDIILLYQQQHI